MIKSSRGDVMNSMSKTIFALALSTVFLTLGVSALDSNILVQCPKAEGTELHAPGDSAIKCEHVVAGDGMVTMADDYMGSGKKQYVFSYARLPPLPVLGDPDYPDGLTETSPEYPAWVMEKGIMASTIPAPLITLDEDDEFFLTLTNVGMTMRPDLFDPHTIHWHGFREAASIFDGVPDSSISVGMGASLTYYYNVQDAGTYMYHCHVEATEHMQMGMMGSLYVRPRQNKLDAVTFNNGFQHVPGNQYVYNDADGSTQYDVEFPIQIMTFDPDFHDASLNVQPLPFAGMKDRYFLMNGRGYPDSVNPSTVMETTDPLGTVHNSQPESSLITATTGQKILIRLSNVSITQFVTIGTIGVSMNVVGLDAMLLRDDAGQNMNYQTNSVTLGGGSTADVIITAPDEPGTYFLYTKNLDKLANDAENIGGIMTKIVISPAA